MYRRMSTLLMVVLAALLSSLAQAQEACPGAPPPRLVRGEMGMVTPGQPNNVREQPTKTAQVVGQLQPGDVFDIWDGPVCAEGYNWWQVRTGADLFGWTPEGSGSDYWLTPYAGETVSRQDGNTLFIDYQGVHFEFAAVLASSVNAKVALAIPEGMTVRPQGTEFTLLDYPGANPKDNPANATLEVYPVKGYQKLGATDEMDRLQTLLKDQPANPDYIPTPALGGAAQIFRAQVSYLDMFGGGKGVRAITMYAQDLAVATNRETFYLYVGITDSGYYVQAMFPVDTAALPDDVDYTTLDFDQFSKDYDTYLKKTVDTLNALSNADFSPNLEMLDALFQSLEITK